MTDRIRVKVETSAGGVVIRTIDGVWHALVILDPYKKWGLPKGHAEDGESPEDTALREVREETGLEDVRIGCELVTIDWYFRAQGEQVHKYTTFYLMYSDRGEPMPQRDEGITRCEWVPLEQAHDRISYDNAREVVKVAQRVVRDGVSEGSAGAHPDGAEPGRSGADAGEPAEAAD